MSARRSRSRSGSGAAGERRGGRARRSDPASPPPPAPALPRSQRKSGSEPEAPPQPPTPAPRKAFSLKKIGPRPPAAKSGPETPVKGSEPRTSEAPTPGAQKSIPAKRSAPRTPAKRSESRIPAERSEPQAPTESSEPQAPTEKRAAGTPVERSARRTPAKRSESRIPAKRSVPPTPAERSEPQAPTESSAPQTPAEKNVPQTPEAAPPVARRTITVKKVVARTQESQSPTSRSSQSATKKKVSLSTEVTLSEKENLPPLQENALLNKGDSPVTTGPVPDVTPTVLGPLTPNTVTRPHPMDARDLEMSRKVRRSYSRLDDLGLGSGSTSTPNYQRRSFFGFERLLSGEELENVSPVVKESKHPAVVPSAEPWGPDSTLPGIPMIKEKRRKRKVPEILKSELDEWAAAMNAQFEAAEKFDLLVE